MFAAAIVLGGLAFLTVDPPSAQAACATGSSVAITSPPPGGGTSGSGPTLQGIFNLRAQTTPTNASGLTFMLLSSSGQQALGGATLVNGVWTLEWDTRNRTNGPAQLMAVAHFGTATTLDCASPVLPVSIFNQPTQAPQLMAAVLPGTWQGAVGATAPFTVDTVYIDQYGRSSHVSPGGVNWQSNRGVATPANVPNTVFRAGTALGIGQLSATVGYNGLSATAAAGVKVVAPTGTTNTGTTATPTPTPTPIAPTSGTAPSPTPAPLSTADATRLAAMPTVFRPADPTNSDPIVSLPTLGCLEKAVGSVRFAEISSGKSQPTAAERRAAVNCFSGPNPIPALLAPVAPASLNDVPKTSDIVTLGKIQNQTVTSSTGEKINALVISGRGAPNSNIFIYIFSDPLVLRAETDDSGEWKYVLETPLDEGKHEVFAVAEKDTSTFVRTSAVPISIAAAAPGSQDGALVVESGWTAGQYGFAGAAALLVLGALGVIFTILRRRRKQPAPLLVPAPGAAPAIVPAPTTLTPAQPAAPTPPAAAPSPVQPVLPNAPAEAGPAVEPSANNDTKI